VTDHRPSIAWVALLRANDQGGANKLIFRLRERLNLEMHLSEVERYWQDETLYRCTFDTPVPEDPTAGLVGAALAIAQRLAPSWQVSGSVGEGNMEGIATEGIAVSGVTWLSFTTFP
jgi:hypothetical protein